MAFKAISGLVISTFVSISAFATQASVSECVANRNSFAEDSCRKIGLKSCSMKIQDGVILFATKDGALTAELQKAYALQGHGTYLTTRHSLNFGGINRGVAIVRDDLKGDKRLEAVEVYLNHDSSGNTYTRLRCR